MKKKANNSRLSFQLLDIKEYAIVNNNLATVTHYLHNCNNGNAKIYKKGFVTFRDEMLRTKYPELPKSTEVKEKALQGMLFEIENVPFPAPIDYKFTFIDLFAGIGGFRIALQNLGGKCVFSSEWDKEAQ